MCICDLFMGKGWLDCGQRIKVILIFVMNSQIFDGDYIMFTYPGLVQIDLSITDYNFCEDNSTAYMTHCTQVRFSPMKSQISTFNIAKICHLQQVFLNYQGPIFIISSSVMERLVSCFCTPHIAIFRPMKMCFHDISSIYLLSGFSNQIMHQWWGSSYVWEPEPFGQLVCWTYTSEITTELS